MIKNSLEYARSLDEKDPLRLYRNRFYFPKTAPETPCIYLVGNSLGLQPKNAKEYIHQELENWAALGVEGHFHSKNPWFSYHELLIEPMAQVVGAKPIETVLMNELTVNLHLMMVSFYRPTPNRYKVLMEGCAFPSDQYAVESQTRFHGYDPTQAILNLLPRPGEFVLRAEDILSLIEREGDSIALILLDSVNYLTGQAFDIPAITKAAHQKGCLVGFDLAHGAGNLLLRLHDWGLDFAVWCTYKYLNAGPGGVGGCFIHERHVRDPQIHRFAGWWGHNKKTRFQMKPGFDPIPGAEGWQISNSLIFQLAALRASLEIFSEATMPVIRQKGDLLTGYLEFSLEKLPKETCTIITPKDPKQRGSQLSLKIKNNPQHLLKKLKQSGVFCDLREPDIIRVAPAPLYNSFEDVYQFSKILLEQITSTHSASTDSVT